MTNDLAYRVEVIGGGLRGARPEQLEALLNELAGDGWRLHSIAPQPNSSRMWVVLTMRESGPGSGMKRKKGWSLNWG